MGDGYWRKLLRVDLSRGTHTVEILDEADLKRFIGGAGLGAEILRGELPPKVGAFEPRNRLIFATGPFQGPAVPGGAKFSIVGISPLSGTFADTAAGAGWGIALKEAGYDVLIVQGFNGMRATRQIHSEQLAPVPVAHEHLPTSPSSQHDNRFRKSPTARPGP